MPKTLLLVDDSVTIQRVIELTFAHEDVRVVSISDGRRAVQWMDSEWPDIVLGDVEVPEMDGYAVASYVKTSPRLKQVPVLILAGAFEPVDQDRANSIGCEGVLVKPFEPQQLVARVKELLSAPPPASGGSRRTESDATVKPFPAAVSGRPNDDNGSAPPLRLNYAAAAADAGQEVLEPPSRPVWEGGAMSGAPKPEPPPAPPQKVSLVNAFSALLAAEQSGPAPAASGGQVSDASIEDAVRRVLSRMTDDLVRRIVVETAERLIKEEIEKIKANPE
jgi:DNA-binding response OmpR family regulator